MKKIIPLLLFLNACNLAPKYQRPDVEMPTAWRDISDEGSTLANIAWWEALGDPILNTLIYQALENNKDLQVAVSRVNEYYGQYEIARAALFPEITMGGNAGKERLPALANFLPDGVDPINPTYGLDFKLSYELDFWGQVRNQTSAAHFEYLAQVENRKTVVLTLVSSVASAYILLRQLDLESIISTETLKSRQESLEIAIDRFEGGLTSQIEVAQAQSVFEEALAAVEDLERRIPQQENLLSILLGENPHEIIRGKTLDELTLPREIPAGLPSDLLTRRPDIVQSENILIAANANIGVARSAFFPQVNLTGLYGMESLSLNTLFSKASRAWEIGGNFLQTIFAGGKLVGGLHVAQAQKREYLFQYEQTILNAFREVNDALIGHQQSKEIVIANEGAVSALRDYLELAWLRYYEGQTQYLTVLDAERQLFSIELTLAKAQGDQFITLINVYKALGGGWVIEADELVPKQ